MSASEERKFSEFLSFGERVKLKSPMMIQGPVISAAREASSERKGGFSARAVGAYTLVRCNSVPSAFRRKVVVLKVCSVVFLKEQIEVSQAVRIPPDAPIDGDTEKSDIRTGRKLLRFAGEMHSSLVSCKNAKTGRAAMSSARTSLHRVQVPEHSKRREAY
jgi:hypothetical protein